MKRFAIYICLLLAACSKSEDEWPADSSRYVIAFSSADLTARALGEDARNENAVTRLDVFFYEGETLAYYPASAQLAMGSGSVTLNIPTATALTLLNRTYTVYVLANCPLPRASLENKTFSALRQTVITNAAGFNPAVFQPQAGFLMDGQLSVTLTAGARNLGRADLKRAAAKIAVNITRAAVTGYTPGVATVVLNNYLDKTMLGADMLYQGVPADYLDSPARTIGDLSVDGAHAAAPFYAYASDWEFDAAKESYLMIAVPWRQGVQAAQTYYYRVPMNYLQAVGETDAHRYRIRRNYIYQFNIDISALGGLDPENAVTLSPGFEVRDWSTRAIAVSVSQYDFLVVYERDVEMNNVSHRAIEYSSNSPIQITSAACYCNEYATDGTVSQKNYAAGSPEFPKVTVNTAASVIEITGFTPINYVPRTLTFTVTNVAGLKQYVTAVMYPPKYITAQKAPDYTSGDWVAGSNLGGGTNNPMGASGQQNFNMFTITTSSLDASDRMPDTAPFYGVPITLGDPTEVVNGIRQTRTDAVSNAIMSPRFVVASQRGISSAHTYDNAVLRCRGYQEYPYPRGSWRVPTAAELAYGNRLQNDANSAVKGLFVAGNNSWWTAAKYYAFNFQSNALTALGTASTTYYIRCVHDVWKDL